MTATTIKPTTGRSKTFLDMELQVEVLSSLEALRAAAPAWDDLCRRSGLASPVLRAEHVEAWCRRFAPGAPFRAPVITDGARLLAALPLVQATRGMPLFAQLTNNHWAITGDLLLDEEIEPTACLRALVRALRRLPWPCVVFRLARYDAQSWATFAGLAASEGLSVACLPADRIGVVHIDPASPRASKRGSRNHRRNVARAVRRMEEAGGRRLRVLCPATLSEVDRLMDQGFAVEDSGWKGESGSSVLRVPGMRDYYVAQARSLASTGHLRLYLLEHDDRTIAFQYAYQNDGGLFLHKIGYDEAYARMSPGHVLTLDLLDQLEAGPEALDVDFGTMTEATAQWADDSYRVGTLVVCLDTPAGRLASMGMRVARWLKQRLRRKPSAAEI